MGAGKSTLGKFLAKELGWPYFDNDTEMTKRYGYSQEQLSSMPVPELHKIESRYLVDVMKQDGPFISGAAASVIDYPENQELLKSATTIYLRIPLNAVLTRAGDRGVGRQALNEDAGSVLTQRYERRDPLYKLVASATVELTNHWENDAKALIEMIKSQA